MKLIIDIPEEEYNRVASGKWEGNPLADYIENGTPLQDGEFLLTLMQSVMTPEQIREVLQTMNNQCELANEVWELYEKYQPHLATSVIEFGDELKELLIKYMKGGENE